MQSSVPTVTFDELAQQERAGKALVRHMLGQLPAPNFSIRQRKGFLNNGVNHNAQTAGLMDWGFCHKTRNGEHLFNDAGRCVQCGSSKRG